MLRGFTPNHRKVMFSVATVESLRLFGIFLVLPVFTPYGSGFTSSGILVGIGFGAYGLAMAVFQIPFGVFSDRVGRKRALLVGMAPYIIGNILCWHPFDIYGLIAGRFIAGAGAISSVGIALLQESVPPERRNIAMAVVGIPVGLSFLVGIVVGPFISSFLGTDYIFLISAVLGAIAYVPLIRLQDDSGRERTVSSRGRIELKSIKLGVISFFVSALMFSYFYYLSLYHGQFLGHASLTLLLLWPVLAGGIVAIAMSGYADRGHAVFTTLICLVILLVSIPLVFTYSYAFISYRSIIAASIAFFVGYSLYEIVFPVLVTRYSSRGSYGANLGVYNVLQFSGQLAGSVVAGGIIGQFITGDGPYIITAILVSGLFVSLTVFHNLTGFREPEKALQNP